MARCKFGTIVTDARGKVGGNMFQANRYGRTFKVLPKQPKRQSEAQQIVRNRFQLISRTWKTLTPEQRKTWADSVLDFTFTNVFGDTVAPSGQLLFQRLNMNMANAGQTIFLEAPTPSPVQEVPEYDFNRIFSPNELYIVNQGGALEANMLLIIDVTRPVSYGVSNVNSFFTKIFQVFEPELYITVDITQEYIQKHGVFPKISSTLYARLRILNTINGLISPPLIKEVINL
jgi:hypothetical protein